MNKLKILLFTIIFFILLNFFSYVLTQRNDAYLHREAFESLPKNSVDIMFIGNSHSICTFDPAIIESLTKKKTFNAAMPGQVLDLAWYNLKYQLTSQNPKIVVLEAFALQSFTSRIGYNDANIQSMHFGYTKLSTVFGLFNNFKDRMELLINIYGNHNNWSNTSVLKTNIKRLIGFDKENNPFINSKGFFGGYCGMTPEIVQKYKDMNIEEVKFKPCTSDYILRYFHKIVHECKKRNIKLILTMAPMNKYFIQKTHYTDIYNNFLELCKKNDILYIDYNMLYDEIHLLDTDFENACHNSQHTNKFGAEKISTHMGNFLANVTTP